MSSTQRLVEIFPGLGLGRHHHGLAAALEDLVAVRRARLGEPVGEFHDAREVVLHLGLLELIDVMGEPKHVALDGGLHTGLVLERRKNGARAVRRVHAGAYRRDPLATESPRSEGIGTRPELPRASVFRRLRRGAWDRGGRLDVSAKAQAIRWEPE